MGKLKMILVIILVGGLLGAGAVYFLDRDSSASEKGKTAEEIAELSIDTDVITTNLASSGHFAVVQFNILLDNEKAKAETEKRTAEVRAAIISTIAGFKKDELIGKEGIATLEETLSTKLEDIVDTGQVERVLVTELKLQ